MASSPTPSHDSISSVTATAENLSLDPPLNEETYVLPTVGSPEPPGMSFAQVCILSGCCMVFSYTQPVLVTLNTPVVCRRVFAVHMLV